MAKLLSVLTSNKVSSSSCGKYFEIRCKTGPSNLRLNVKNGEMYPGTPVVMWPDHPGDNQVWYEDPLKGTVRSLHSHMCLDLDGSDNLCVNPYKKSEPAQMWHINKERDGVIENRTNFMRTLEIVTGKDGKVSQGDGLKSNVYHGGSEQKFILEHKSNKYFHLKSLLYPSKVIEVSNVGKFKSKLGAKVVLAEQCQRLSEHQLWFEDYLGNIKSKINDKLCLDGSNFTICLGEYKENKLKCFWVPIGDRLVNKDDFNQVIGVNDTSETGQDRIELSVGLYKGCDSQHIKVKWVE